jgi:response regulator RpfG family c-di-GMP phosphodiesterase
MEDKTVLFVDDEANVLTALKRLLRKEPYQVLTASSAAEGLETLKQNEVQIVVSDQRMPGMVGTEFLQKVKEMFPDTVRVILSGYADVSVVVESINKGEVFRFLGKPWNDEELKAIVRQCLSHYDIVKQKRLLEEQTIRQNEELQKLNQKLEQLVDLRTRCLQFSQELLEYLPMPVMGVSLEEEIVLVNAAAVRSHPEICVVPPGSHIDEVMPELLAENIRKCLRENKSQEQFAVQWDGEAVWIKLSPLGAPEIRGCIIITEKV